VDNSSIVGGWLLLHAGGEPAGLSDM